MRWRDYFIPTTKETPKDAAAASHVLMLRAGLIRQLAAGIYSYLPLGYRVLRKVERIVREEMERAGAIELHMPVLQPLDLWYETGRVGAMGDVLLRLRPVYDDDERDWRAQTVLGPTHEEVVTEIARAYVNSYKQLPLNLFQIQVKFRGEARPKSGVLRTREFLMKDAYSFDTDKAGLDVSYQKMYDAYCRIFGRCGLPYLAVEAESGPIGGDASHEFMVLTDAGEDQVAISENGDYAANLERATCSEPEGLADALARAVYVPSQGPMTLQSGVEVDPAAEPVAGPRETHTPGAGRVEDVCKVLGTTPAQMIKTLIFATHPPAAEASGKGKDRPPPRLRVVALVRGDHELNEHKLAKVSGLKLELAEPPIIEELTGAAVGFAGPHRLFERLKPGELLIVDRDVAVMKNAASGANKTDFHVTHVEPGRDFPLRMKSENGGSALVADIRNVTEGDLSPGGSGSPLRLRTAIEVGHVFKLGTKYSDSMKATFLDKDGKPKPFIMGCYGIGLNRIVAAAIEANHDANGIIWPRAIAPFEAIVIALDPRDEHVMQVASEIHDKLAAEGVDVLLDDRDERAGFKFKDADLIGVPLRIVIGKKSLADGVVEASWRSDPNVKENYSPADVVTWALARLGAGS